ncbi:MAG: aminodeoxychorismate synthase, component I [Deltaproteobacteria bacterium]|nr:MAG: aminodeoxychorismate synthase, component I [Deltaproteobacteria bacterium]
MTIHKLPGGWSAAKAFRHAAKRPYPFFLDGAGGPDKYTNHSFVGADPFLVVHAKGRDCRIDYPREGRSEKKQIHPFDLMKDLFSKYCVEERGDFPLSSGGAVGYLAYDLFPLIENIEQHAVDDINMPDLFFTFHDVVLAFDNRTGEASLAVKEGAPKEVVDYWLSPPPEETPPTFEPLDIKVEELIANETPEEYREAVERAREYIAAGEVYQVNLSRRFTIKGYKLDPIELYLQFRKASPAPFGACLFPDGFAVLSNSPERYLLIDGDYIETRPIKGTRPRGRDPEEDALLARELKESIKDSAEHIMIVDLERNDLGRVSSYNSVHVPDLAVLESYANVHHIVSTVAGKIHPSRDLVDCIRNSFPGGSITGAPKVRALSIIDELEPTARGVYCGSIGYIDFSGRVDLNIAIRTAIMKDDTIHFQVGGGIVIDSDPEEEFEETITKAQSFIKAVTGRGRVWGAR